MVLCQCQWHLFAGHCHTWPICLGHLCWPLLAIERLLVTQKVSPSGQLFVFPGRWSHDYVQTIGSSVWSFSPLVQQLTFVRLQENYIFYSSHYIVHFAFQQIIHSCIIWRLDDLYFRIILYDFFDNFWKIFVFGWFVFLMICILDS